MKQEPVVRWSGLALLIGGVALVIAMLFHPDDSANPGAVTTPIWAGVHGVFALAALFMLFGLIGMYARQREEVGALGLLGFVLTFAGMVMFVPVFVLEAFVIPAIARSSAGQSLLDPTGPLFAGPLGIVAMLTGIVSSLGILMTVIATIRGGILPRLAAMLLLGGILTAFWPPLPWIAGVGGGVLFGLGFAWMGYAVWAGYDAQVARPSLAR